MTEDERTPATASASLDSPIATGQQAPRFELPAVASDGTQITVGSDEMQGKRVLLIFYQDDGMPICTSELKAFAQEHDTLTEAGVTVYGFNTNGLGSHARFQERDRFPFPLISDFYGDVVKAFGFWDERERKSQRALVIIATDGVIEYVQSHFNPGNLAGFEEVFETLGLL